MVKTQCFKKKKKRLNAFTVHSLGSIPGWKTKISQPMESGQKKKEKESGRWQHEPSNTNIQIVTAPKKVRGGELWGEMHGEGPYKKTFFKFKPIFTINE